jgi:hypothetical protein
LSPTSRFVILAQARSVWGTEPVEESIDQSLRESPAMDEATEFLIEALSPAGKQVQQQHIVEQAGECGIKDKTLRRAKKKLGITSTETIDPNGRKYWFWKLPENDDKDNNT